MIVWVILIGVLVTVGFTQWINANLPKWISPQSFGLAEWLYRWLNIIAPFFLLYSLTSLHYNFISILVGAMLYWLAYAVKRLAWNSAYGENLKMNKEFGN